MLPWGFLSAQGFSRLSTDTTGSIEVRELLGRLEQKHAVNIYYKPEWFENRHFHASLVALPLPEAIDRIESLCSLTHLVIDSSAIVFIPRENPAPLPGAGESSLLVIGNPAESGKYTQAVLSGAILDGTSGEPLPGAIVAVSKQKAHSVTDREGRYSLLLPTGEHNLSIKFVGYEEVRQSIRLVSTGNKDFQVFEKSLQLQPVIITDERMDMNISRTQMSTIRLDAKAIRELPTSLGETDIMRSVTLLPGIQSVGEFGSGFIVRGGNADQNLVLIEDVPLFNSSHLFGLNSVVNPDVLASVTLFKAGIPARYGERASSVMAIRLGPANIKSLKVKGGIGLLNSRLSLETPIGKRSSLILAGRSSYSDWLLHRMPDIDLKNSSAGFFDLNGLYSFNPGKHDKITLFGYYSADNFSFSKSSQYHYSNLLGSARWNHIFNKNLSFNLLCGISRYLFSLEESDSLRRYDANRIDLGILYRNLKWTFNWFPGEKHSIEFGISGILYRNEPGELLPNSDESIVIARKVQQENGREAAFFLSDDIAFTKGINAEIGLRAGQYTSLGPLRQYIYSEGLPKSVETIIDTLLYENKQEVISYRALEPRISFRFRLDEEKSVKMSFTRMNQFLTLLSNTSVISPTDAWKLAGPHFKPLACDQLAVGYFNNLDKNRIEASIEVYYKRYRNILDYKNGAEVLLNDHLETDVLTSAASGYGVELYINKNTGRLTGWISYTYSRSMHSTSGATEAEQINGNRKFPSGYDIPHNLVMNLNYHISRRWRFSSTFTYHTGKPVTLPELKYVVNGNQLILFSDRNKYRLPDYHRLDIAITRDQSLNLKKRWKGSWTLSVVNLYGRKNAYSAYYAKEDPRTWDYNGSYNLYTLYILGVPFPTLTYNFSF